MSRATNRFASFSLAALFLASAVLPVFAHAQSLPGATEPVTLRLSPSSPRPNSTVTATLESFSVDLSRSDISWYVNGKAVSSGKGSTSITLQSGAPGSLITVSADVSTIDLGMFSIESSFRAADVTLIWKSDASIPPFYRGKALESYGGSFQVTAIPEFFSAAGKRMDPKTLVYTWRKNGVVDSVQSGYGKDSFSGSQSSFVRGGDEISVSVSNTDGGLSASRSVTVSPVVPEIIFYEESPLYGPDFEHALQESLTLIDEEVTLRGELFNASVVSPANSFPFNWTMNDALLPEWSGKRSITLRKTEGFFGQSRVGVSVQHPAKMLQAAQAAITIYQ